MAKKIKRYKVGCDSETYAISLVEAPAIESEFVALAKEEEKQVFLESNERHMVYGAALIPDMDIYRNDGEHEYYISFSKESIEKMSQDFMKEYRQYEVKTDHEDVANEVCVVESWLVSDAYKDKSNALGINVPEGSWMVGMKVNNIETWDRIKAGELKGFSVESLVSLEEFGSQTCLTSSLQRSKIDNNMEIETNEMFWTKLVNVLKETFSKKEEEEPVAEPTEIESTNIDLEAEPAPAPAEPVSEPSEPVSEPQPVVDPQPAPEPAQEPQNEPEPVVEAPKADTSKLEELIGNLKAEIEALKETNTGLQNKISEMGKQPSAAPINTNAKPGAGDTYSAWREQMRSML